MKPSEPTEQQVKAIIREGLRLGEIEVSHFGEHGEPYYKLTQKGQKKCDELISSNPHLLDNLGIVRH